MEARTNCVARDGQGLRGIKESGHLGHGVTGSFGLISLGLRGLGLIGGLIGDLAISSISLAAIFSDVAAWMRATAVGDITPATRLNCGGALFFFGAGRVHHSQSTACLCGTLHLHAPNVSRH